MIVLLHCSINLLANDSISSTGGLDSVSVSYDDLRIVNSKLVELDYTKQINNKLRYIVSNDSIIIGKYETVNKDLVKKSNKYKKQRNIAFITTLIGIATTTVVLISK